MCWQSFNSSPVVTTLSQNYSTTFEKLPASTIFCFNTEPPLHSYGKTGSGGTELADYGLDLETYTPERLVSVINRQDGGAPRQHDPSETPDQISDDDLTQDAPKMKMKLLKQPAEQEINVGESAGPELLSALTFPRAISTRNSTMLRIQSSPPPSPQ